MTTFDIWMQVVLIYSLNLSIQFYNDKVYTLLRVFTLAYASMSPEFQHRFAFWMGLFLAMTERQLLKKDKNKG